MKDKNAPMTDGQFQTLHNLMRKIDGKLDNFQGDISQIKRDVKVISETLMLERDSKGQLRKAS